MCPCWFENLKLQVVVDFTNLDFCDGFYNFGFKYYDILNLRNIVNLVIEQNFQTNILPIR